MSIASMTTYSHPAAAWRWHVTRQGIYQNFSSAPVIHYHSRNSAAPPSPLVFTVKCFKTAFSMVLLNLVNTVRKDSPSLLTMALGALIIEVTNQWDKFIQSRGWWTAFQWRPYGKTHGILDFSGRESAFQWADVALSQCASMGWLILE